MKTSLFNSFIRTFLKTKAITMIFLVALYVLIFGSYLVYQQIQNIVDVHNQIIHVYQVVGKADNLLLSVLDVQRLEQNYLNSKKEKYLKESQNGLRSIQENLLSLEQAMSGNMTHRNNLAMLDSQVQKIMKLFQEVLKKERGSGIQTLSSPEYQLIIDTIKHLIVSMNNVEFLLLEGRNEKLVTDARQTDLLVIIIGSLSNFMILLSFLLLNYREQKHLKEQLEINKELEEKNIRIQESNRLKSEFLANMSHELRTPLNAIIGFSELMRDERVGDVTGEQKGFLNNILVSGRELLRLINNVLDLSKIEADKMTFHPDNVNLPQLVNEVVNSLRDLSDKKKICLTACVDESLDSIRIDGDRLKQILYNYLSNALKFTPDLGSVQIRIKPETDSSIRLEVEDNGIGIKKEDLQRLFVEFQQLDSSKAKKYQGTGLGLALTKHLVEAQGGVVGVVSTPGKGSVFYAVLSCIVTQKNTHNFSVSALDAVKQGGNLHNS